MEQSNAVRGAGWSSGEEPSACSGNAPARETTGRRCQLWKARPRRQGQAAAPKRSGSSGGRGAQPRATFGPSSGWGTGLAAERNASLVFGRAPAAAAGRRRNRRRAALGAQSRPCVAALSQLDPGQRGKESTADQPWSLGDPRAMLSRPAHDDSSTRAATSAATGPQHRDTGSQGDV